MQARSHFASVRRGADRLRWRVAVMAFLLASTLWVVPTAASATCGTLQGRIDRAPAGSVLDLAGCSYRTGATIAKNLTLRGATIHVSGQTRAITVAADNVTLVGLRITGSNSSGFDGRETGVFAQGRAADVPLRNLTIRGCEISSFGGYGIYMRYVERPIIADTRIHDIVYAGIHVMSGHGGLLIRNRIQRIGVTAADLPGEGNAYGITLSRIASGDVFRDPPTSDFSVVGNTIEDVPTWHAIDTHAGLRVSIKGNVVRGAMRAIFVTSDADGNKSTDVVVSGNFLVAPLPRDNLIAVTIVDTVGVRVTGNHISTGWRAGVYDYGDSSVDLLVSGNSTP